MSAQTHKKERIKIILEKKKNKKKNPSIVALSDL